MPKVREIILIVITVVAVSSAVRAHYTPEVRFEKEYVEIRVPEKVLKIKTVRVPCTVATVIPKEKALKELKDMPESVKSDEDKQVTTVGDIPPYEGTTRVAAIFDIRTGDSVLHARQLPRSFFGFVNTKELGMRYGLASGGSQIDLYGRWTFARVSSIHLSAYAAGNTSGSGFAGLDAGLRW